MLKSIKKKSISKLIMKIYELAKILNATVPEILEHYKKIFVEIPNDENFILTTEQIKKAIPKYNPKNYLAEPEDQSINNEITSVPQATMHKTKEIDPYETTLYNQFFQANERQILNYFKQHNKLQNLLFEGEYSKIQDTDFGFFRNITHESLSKLTYPITNEPVEKIFVAKGRLQNGHRYQFEVQCASIKERQKKNNPFLLQVDKNRMEEIAELSEITSALQSKKSRLQEINVLLDSAETDLDEKLEEIEIKISTELEKKQNEADKIIENYNESITQKYEEIQIKEYKIHQLNNNLEILDQQLKKMENLANTLRDRISLCKNLQFITDAEEQQFLRLLKQEKITLDGHLDFEENFENDFEDLSRHIHTYLVQKKDLIYSKHQIDNFLTLLRTHDIIILSGLSGSGKTQIVKSFAEAIGGVSKIIPVKPSWTSSEDLLGYYNPIQMTFLPTPFTESIVEAILNPKRIYLICLDEMNLARAEYYFADFLSKLEDRNSKPEIDLYAKHEEELFVSEFNALLNLLDSCITNKPIKSWQDFLNDEDARSKFFSMMGNVESESMLQLHSKMKRRMIDILKFPSKLVIPENVRFIGAINIDETTHYFSPKILDRVHIMKFENPLLFEESVRIYFENNHIDRELKPVYVSPEIFSKRSEFPTVNDPSLKEISLKLKEINAKYLLPLNIDFGIRSIRQALNYANLNKANYNHNHSFDISLNTIIIQKIFPRFIFDGTEIATNGELKDIVIKELQKFLADEFNSFYETHNSKSDEVGILCSNYLEKMIHQAERSNSQYNFFA